MASGPAGWLREGGSRLPQSKGGALGEEWLELLVEGHAAIELFFPVDAGCQLIDAASEALVGFATLNVGGQILARAWRQGQQRREECGVEVAEIERDGQRGKG